VIVGAPRRREGGAPRGRDEKLLTQNGTAQDVIIAWITTLSMSDRGKHDLHNL